jgi:hypothetical protein
VVRGQGERLRRYGKHTIQYKDGDVQKLLLRHEAVLFLDLPGLDGPGTDARLSCEPEQAAGAHEAEQGSCSTGLHLCSECVSMPRGTPHENLVFPSFC